MANGRGASCCRHQWVADATRNQVEDVWMGEFDGKQYLPRDKNKANEAQREGYGYQWWMTEHGGYYASGVFGQQCMVLPDQDTVMVFTCGLRLGEKRLHAALFGSTCFQHWAARPKTPRPARHNWIRCSTTCACRPCKG